MLSWRSCLLIWCLSLASPGWTQNKQPEPDLRGSISEQNSYTNSALGMTINLPGQWQILERRTATPYDPNCSGPLCGSPDINDVLETKPGGNAGYRLYLSGWRLSPEYLNRNRYPLRWFAKIMMEGSLGGSGLVPFAEQTSIQFSGKPAYRLLAGKPGDKMPRSLGYVSEAHGYVFLLVGAAPVNPEVLQSAIEGMKFH